MMYKVFLSILNHG